MTIKLTYIAMYICECRKKIRLMDVILQNSKSRTTENKKNILYS